MSIKIQQCKFEDIKFIPENFEKGYASFAKRKKEEIWFSAIQKEKIIGCACILILNSNTIRLSNLFVLPDFRKKGVAQKLVIAREMWGKIRNFKYVDTRSVKKYYKDHGYVPIKEYKVGGWWWKKEL